MQATFARKLGMTAAALRCGTRKELCARFRAVNPQTEFDLERSFKWLQGKALPRSATVYEDWAKVLGSARPGAWIAACSVAAFTDEIVGLFSLDLAEVQAAADRFLGEGIARQTAQDGLSGSFLCYSWAWSPYHSGELIRGVMDLRQGQKGAWQVGYAENIPGRTWAVSGTGRRSGRMLAADLIGDVDEHLMLTLLVPGKPANVLGGHMQGVTIHGVETQICATRIVMLRAGDGLQAEGPCFVAATPEALASDMARQAQGGGDEVMAAAILAFLRGTAAGGADRVTPAALGPLVEITQQG